MKLLKKTKQGNLHYILDDGRIGAIYPATGYVRVSHSMKSFPDTERGQHYLSLQRRRNISAIRDGNTGSLKMYQINPKRKYDRYVVFDTDKWGRELYIKLTSAARVLYPNDTIKLVLMLQKFNAKNCN